MLSGPRPPARGRRVSVPVPRAPAHPDLTGAAMKINDCHLTDSGRACGPEQAINHRPTAAIQRHTTPRLPLTAFSLPHPFFFLFFFFFGKRRLNKEFNKASRLELKLRLRGESDRRKTGKSILLLFQGCLFAGWCPSPLNLIL